MARDKSKRMAKAMQDPQSVSVAEISEKSLYWCGMLPASKPFPWRIQVSEYNEEFEDFLKVIQTTTKDLFEKDTAIWRGRCEGYQGLSVSGFQFSAFSELKGRNIGGGVSMTPWPGNVVELDDEQVTGILKSCFRRILRGSGPTIKLMSLDHGTARAGTEQDQVVTKDRVYYNPKTDTFVAYYVYLIPLNKRSSEVEADNYIRLVPSWDEFFAAPPKSVLEMYPEYVPVQKAVEATKNAEE